MVSSAMQFKLLQAQVHNLESQATLNTSSAAEAESRIVSLRKARDKMDYEIDNLREQTRNIKTEADMKEYARDHMQELQAKFQSLTNEMMSAGLPAAKAEGEFWTSLSRAGLSPTFVDIIKTMIMMFKPRGGGITIQKP
jgi:uncharacterized coiled-coil DUF342 family protein